MKIERITKIAIYVAILCITAYISFPLPFSPTPITAQTIVINMMALVLVPIDVVFVMIVYILLGIIGIPVFSGGVYGIGKIMGPSGGYIIGMVFAAWAISILKGKKINMKWYLFMTIFVGMPVIYIGGIISMSVYLKQSISTMIKVSILPYLPGDLLKCAAGSYLGFELNRRLNREVRHE